MTVRVGIDVGGTKCLGLVIADAGTAGAEGPSGGDSPDVIVERQVSTPTNAPDLVDTLVALLGELEDAAGERAAEIGIGVPGLVDRDGVLRFAPNLSAAAGLEVRSVLGERTGRSVRVENDASCAVWGERLYGAAAGFDDVVMVTLGTGIGGGLVVGGRLVRGSQGFAAEVGHMVVDAHGPPCPCGQRGCWERFASGSGLGRLGREAGAGGRIPRVVEQAGGDPEAIRGEHVTAAVGEGDPAAQAVLDEVAWWVGLGLANLANVIDPAVMVVGGGLVEIGPPLMDPVRAAFGQLVTGAGARPPIPVVAARLGSRSGAVGAACLDLAG